MHEAFKDGEVSIKICANKDSLNSQLLSKQMNAVMRNRQEMKQQHQDGIDALRFDALRSYCASSAYEKFCHNEWIRHSQEAINKQLGIPQRYFGIDPAQERNTMEVSHSKYKIIKPTKYCKIEVSAEDADFVQKLEAVYNRGGKYSLKSKLCFQVETFFGAEVAQVYKDNQQLAPFRSAGHVQILPENLKAIGNVIFATQSHLDNFGFSNLHVAYGDRAWSLRKKISKSLEEYSNHAR